MSTSQIHHHRANIYKLKIHQRTEKAVKVCDKWTESRSFCLFILGKRVQTQKNALKKTKTKKQFTNEAEIHNLYQQFLNQHYFPFYKTVRFYTT